MRLHMLLIATTLSLSMLVGCGSDPNSGAMEGQKLPDAEFISLTGEKLRISDFAGKPVVLNFWATWCGPCKEEIPELQAAFDQYNVSDGLQIIGITDELSVDVKPFVEANRMTFPIAYDRSGRASSRYRVQSIPTTLFVNAEGIVMTRHTGALTQGRLRLYIDRLLSDVSPAAPTVQPSSQPSAPTTAPAQPTPVPDAPPTQQPAQPNPPPPTPPRNDVGLVVRFNRERG